MLKCTNYLGRKLKLRAEFLLPAVRSAEGLLVQEDVGFASGPVAGHPQAGTHDEQIPVTHTHTHTLWSLPSQLW